MYIILNCHLLIKPRTMIPKHQLLRLRVASRSTGAARRALSSTCARKHNAAPAAPAETAPNSRWLSDIRHRLSTGISKRADESKVVAQLKHHMSFLDQHRLNLSAGREGFLIEPQWRGLDKHNIAWGDMVSLIHLWQFCLYIRATLIMLLPNRTQW